MDEVAISPVSPQPLQGVLTPERFDEFQRGAAEARRLLDGRVVWNVNSTASGGGVVELLRPLVGYARGAGVDARWVVIRAGPEFFAITKRIHNWLHGVRGDGGRLDEAARAAYEGVLAENLVQFAGRVHPGDVVIVHDPQPAGLIPALAAAGAKVIWRCHIGIDAPNALARDAWTFLKPYVTPAHAYVFSRAAFVWEGLDRGRIAVIAPSIDPFAPKNEPLAPDTVRGVLHTTGVLAGDSSPPAVFLRHDGTRGRVERPVRLVEDAPIEESAPVVLQVSRWDALKDPLGVIRGFAEHVPAETGAHLLYAGPDVESVVDDPEGGRVLREAVALRASLPAAQRARIHLASLPIEDAEENAIIVNALQRHAAVVTQKSLAEGFGLTVAEAMWKARPVVASRIGGIQEQIVHGDTGWQLPDPADLAAFGAAVTHLLNDPAEADRMGARAQEHVRARFLSVRSLLDYLALIRTLLEP